MTGEMSQNQQVREAYRREFGRELYEFYCRETRRGQDYLIWKLVSSPWPGHAIGNQWERLA
jgi:hypothetical protein